MSEKRKTKPPSQPTAWSDPDDERLVTFLFDTDVIETLRQRSGNDLTGYCNELLRRAILENRA